MASEVHQGTTTLLRRYTIKPGCWEEFLQVWREIILVRRRYGFKILFAFADREKNIFTWAISHDGDIKNVEERYQADPERVRLRTVEKYVSAWEVTEVTPEAIA